MTEKNLNDSQTLSEPVYLAWLTVSATHLSFLILDKSLSNF